MLKIWKLIFNKEESNHNAQQLKWLYSDSLLLSPTKSYYCNVFLSIWNNFLEQNWLDKPVFSNINRLNHSSPMNSTVTKKVKQFRQLFTLRSKIALIRKWHSILSWLIIITKLDIYIYKYKDDYIYKGLLQVICLVTINIWVYFLL